MKKKASKGRPKHPAGMRAKVMSLWISLKREKKIKRIAKRNGISVSEAIGRLIDAVNEE
jgi:cytidylate kinase